MLLKQAVINDINISSPIFNINIKGVLPSLRSGADTSDVKVRIKNLGNILIYLKRWISFIDESVSAVGDVNIHTDQANQINNVEDKNGQENLLGKTQSEIATEEEFDDFDIISTEDKMEEFIIDLARKNPNSNDVSSEFHLFGSGFNMVINNVPFMEVLSDFTKIIGPIIAKISIKIKKSEVGGNIDEEGLKTLKGLNNNEKDIKDAVDIQNINVKKDVENIEESDQIHQNKDIKQQDLDLKNDKSSINSKEPKKNIETPILPNKTNNKDSLNDAKIKLEKELNSKGAKSDEGSSFGDVEAEEGVNLKVDNADNEANKSKSEFVDNDSIDKKLFEDNSDENDNQNLDSLEGGDVPLSPLDAMKYIEDMDQDINSKDSQ